VVDRTSAKRAEPLTEVRARSDIVVTSYTLLRLDEDEYGALPWGAVIFDEAQFVKNRTAATYRSARRLRARVKFAVTGTPMENNLMDLWSMLSIATPGLFPSPDTFTDTYRTPIEAGGAPDVLARLRRRVRPVLMRRTKEEVATELPPKQEQVLSIPLSAGHRRLYDRHLAAVRKQVLGLVGDLDHNRIAVLASLTRLRQLSLSPALVEAGQPPVSAKIDALVEMLGDMIAEGHRALVFSQFTSFLALVKARLDAEHISYVYLDGRTRNREQRINSFKNGTDPVFLISLKAGGFGLNLTEADYVFVLDPWWNPAVENQAIDRAHRIGQESTVMVYRLVSEDTIEEKVVALQERKRALFDSVVGEASSLAAPLSAEDIRGLFEPD
jgi:SNF2 family DNA or RNA helicase